MPVDSNNICSNLTLNILRGEESSWQSIFVGRRFPWLSRVCCMFVSSKLSYWLSSQERDICSSPLFCPCYVWVAVHLHWKRTVFKAKWNGFELAEFGSVKTTTCKDIGSGRPFWEFWPHS